MNRDVMAPKQVAFIFGMVVATLATFISLVFTLGYAAYAGTVDVVATTIPVLILAELFKLAIPFWAVALWEARNFAWARWAGALWLVPAFACCVAYINYAEASGGTRTLGSNISSLERELSQIETRRPLTQIQEDLARVEMGEERDELRAEAREAQKAVDLRMTINQLKWKAEHSQGDVKPSAGFSFEQVNMVLTLNAVQFVGALALALVAWSRPRPTPPEIRRIGPLSQQDGGNPSNPSSSSPSMGGGSSQFMGPPPSPPFVQAEAFVPAAPSIVRKMDRPPSRDGFRRASSIKPVPERWLWPDALLEGKLALLAGQGGVGKSTIAAFIAAVAGRGGQWPTGEAIKPGGVIFCETEDEIDQVTIPRLLGAGADLERVEVTDKRFDLAHDISGIEQAADRLKNDIGQAPSLLVLSPIRTFFGKKESYNDSEIRQQTEKLLNYAAAKRMCVLGITHMTKDGKSMGGSQAWINASRAGLLAEWVGGVGGPRQVRPLKANSGTVGWSIPFDTQAVTVDGCPTVVTAWGEKTYAPQAARFERSEVVEDVEEEFEEEIQPQTPRQYGRDDVATQKAMAFIARTMAEGKRMGDEIISLAAEAGISRATLDRAANKLGVVKTPAGKTNEWGWAS